MLSAIRYTFAEAGASFDELLGSVILDFLSLLSDADLVGTSLPQPDRHTNFETDRKTPCALSAQLRRSIKTAPHSRPLVNATPALVQGDCGQPGPYPYCADGSLDAQG